MRISNFATRYITYSIFMAKELFERIDRQVKDLLTDVSTGKIGLPDLQRPFVWQDNKIRDLLDSMLHGFPVGYIMLWGAPEEYENTKTIGVNTKAFSHPQDLVIDGQQRLTSLIAAMQGIQVTDKNFKKRNIRISFNPLQGKFEVWTAAYEKDTEWIPDISAVYLAEDNHTLRPFTKELIKRINEGREKKNLELLSEDELDVIDDSIRNILSLRDYTIPTLKIKGSASEEDVAEIFKRVNSGGQNLNENNFIQTLLAVYDNEMFERITKFCSDSRTPQEGTSYNRIIDLDPSHIVRITVGLAFQRGRLGYAYKILRGRDLETGITSQETRDANLNKFKSALDKATNINDWHTFLNLFANAGYQTGQLVSSSYVVIYSYVLYLLGKHTYKVPVTLLQKAITKWIFMTSVTRFFSTSPESTVERLFADMRNVTNDVEYLAYLESIIDQHLTEDFFNVTLIADLTNSAASSPAWFAYVASINLLGTATLFSNTPQSHFFSLGADGMKKAVDKHHIFPKNYLAQIGIEDDRDRNQIANFTYLDYTTNIDISDNPPVDYIERYKAKLGEEAFKKTCEDNALPVGFEKMEYQEFLQTRRPLMAKIIHKAYDRLCGK